MTEHKAEKFSKVAVANGWKSQVQTWMEDFYTTGDIKDIHWNVYAKRGEDPNAETMMVVWIGNRFYTGLYRYNLHMIKIFWKHEAVKFLEGKPDPTKAYKGFRDTVTEVTEIARSVPWRDDTPAINILLEVIRKQITWLRKVDNKVCTAVVDVNLNEQGSAKHFRISNGKSGRVLEWADALGFHAVALDQIINVS